MKTPAVMAVMLSLAPRPSAAESLFADGRTGNVSGPENQFYELGTIFRTAAAGTVTRLRVYAVSTETGLHTARLWRNSTNSLIGGPYAWAYGGTTGWITLDIPDVPVLADRDYTVVVTTGQTNGSGDRPYPFRGGDLAVAGGNGANLTHTNFKLEKSGEYLALKDHTGAVVSEFAPAYPGQRADVAWGAEVQATPATCRYRRRGVSIPRPAAASSRTPSSVCGAASSPIPFPSASAPPRPERKFATL